MEDNKESLEYCSKCLFTASENIRECLDTMDLKDVDIGYYKAYLDATYRLLEEMAKTFQKKARS